jgi:hypothetical protein
MYNQSIGYNQPNVYNQPYSPYQQSPIMQPPIIQQPIMQPQPYIYPPQNNLNYPINNQPMIINVQSSNKNGTLCQYCNKYT